MKMTKKILSLLLALVLVLGLLPAAFHVNATEEAYVYLSVSFDDQYITDKHGNTIVYMPVPLDAIAAVELTA